MEVTVYKHGSISYQQTVLLEVTVIITTKFISFKEKVTIAFIEKTSLSN